MNVFTASFASFRISVTSMSLFELKSDCISALCKGLHTKLWEWNIPVEVLVESKTALIKSTP
jgi:hypothetical protein